MILDKSESEIEEQVRERKRQREEAVRLRRALDLLDAKRLVEIQSAVERGIPLTYSQRLVSGAVLVSTDEPISGVVLVNTGESRRESFVQKLNRWFS